MALYPVNDEFQAVVERSTRLLLIAYVFQTWTTEDEVEYAKTWRMRTF